MPQQQVPAHALHHESSWPGDFQKSLRFLGSLEIAPGGSVRGERANLKKLVLGVGGGCIEAKFCKKKTRWKALAEIYTMHSFAPFWNRIPKNEENHGGGKDPGPIPGK